MASVSRPTERPIMTTTPHGQVPAIQRETGCNKHSLIHCSQCAHDKMVQGLRDENERLHAYCQELESQVIRDCMTHVQTPAEIEHVAGDVSKNGAEVNMSTQPVAQQGETSEPTPPKGEELRALSDRYWGREDLRDAHAAGVTCGFALGVRALRTQQPAPATQQARVSLRRIERTTFPSSPAHRVLSAFCGAMSDSGIDGADMRAAMLWFLGYEETYASPTAQADSQPAPVAAFEVVYEQKENEMQVWFRPARMHGHPERTPIKATITKDRGNGIVDLTYDDGEFSGNARAVPNALRLPRNVREQVAVWWDVGFEMDFQTAVDNSLKKKKDDPPPQPSPTPQADSVTAPADGAVAVPSKHLPYEPTSTMLIAARERDPALPIETVRAIYWAMWRTAPAAPTPPAQAAESVLEFEMQHGSAIDAARKQGGA